MKKIIALSVALLGAAALASCTSVTAGGVDPSSKVCVEKTYNGQNLRGNYCSNYNPKSPAKDEDKDKDGKPDPKDPKGGVKAAGFKR